MIERYAPSKRIYACKIAFSQAGTNICAHKVQAHSGDIFGECEI